MGPEQLIDPLAKHLLMPVARPLIMSALASAFWRHWQYPQGSMEKVRRDCISIFRRSKNVPQDIYISAGKLDLMGRLLIELKDMQDCRNCVGKIYVKRLSSALFQHLTQTPDGIPALIPADTMTELENRLREVRDAYGHENVKVAEWPGFPRFHGVVYGEFMCYYPWWVNKQGTLSHHTPAIFMQRSYDPQTFDGFKEELKSGFA